MLAAALLSTAVTLAVPHNGTHHFTNSYMHTERRAYPLEREGHNRTSAFPGCGEWCRKAAKHHRMEAVMKMKVEQHAECAEANECPINRAFKADVKCVDGKAGDYECNNIDMLSFVPIQALGSTYDASDSWGWTDPDTGDEIAIISMMDGTAFVQITNPTEPIVLGFMKQSGTNRVIWGDMKVYNDHVFQVRESQNHGMQVYDLTELRQYYGKPSAFVRDIPAGHTYREVTSVHNIVINEQTGFAYLVGSKTCSGGLHAVDISAPMGPRFVGCFATDGYTHDAQCVIYDGPDTKHTGKEICFNYNEDTLTIVDVSVKSNMVMLGRLSYDKAYYTHQGWLTEDQSHLLLNDELDEIQGSVKNTRTMIWNVEDLENPKLIGSHYAEMQSVDHNLYIKGDVGYLSNYCSGLRLLDTKEIGRAVTPEIAFFDMVDYCDGTSFKGAWSNYPYFKSGSIVVSSIELGLFVLKVSA